MLKIIVRLIRLKRMFKICNLSLITYEILIKYSIYRS